MALKFIVVDDMPPPLFYAQAALRSIGEIVALGRNGKDAIRLCEEHRPDVVILDIAMPEMTGSEAARKILADGTARFVCLATSQRQESIIAPLVKLGAYVVTKPYEKRTLRQEIEAIVNGQA